MAKRKILYKIAGKKWFRRLFFSGILLFFLIVSAIIISNTLVENSAENLIYTRVEDIPANKAGLLLGTSKYVAKGRENKFYKYRIQAAVDLYNAGKIEYIIVSGDNGTIQYNEPVTMQQDLIAMGIPKEKIFLDYAGFRTLDSVVRCREIFSQNAITVISQEFHNERAVFIARKKGMEAIGYNAASVGSGTGIKTYLREYLARVKMVLDLYLLHEQPKYLGEKVNIP